MKKLNWKSTLVISGGALIVSASAISVAIIYQPKDVVKQQQQLLNPQGGKTTQGLEVSAYFNLIQALGFDVNTNLKTYDDQVIADRLSHWGFNQDQLSLTIASADSQTKELKFAIKVNGQALAPIAIKGLNWDASLSSSRTINNFNLENPSELQVISFDQDLWWADNYPLQLQGKWNAKQIAFLTKLTSAQIKAHISDLKIRLDQPLFGKDLITKQDQWWSYLNFQFVENKQGQLDLNITLDHPDWHQSHLQWKAGKWIEQDLAALENRLQWNQVNNIWGHNWTDSFVIGGDSLNSGLNAKQVAIIDQQVFLNLTKWDLEKAIMTNQVIILDQLVEKLVTMVKTEAQLKQIFGFEDLNARIKILEWKNDKLRWGWQINGQIIASFETGLNDQQFKTFGWEQLRDLKATIGLHHLSPFAIAFVKQLKSDSQLIKLINDWINNDQDFTYQLQFNNFALLLQSVIGNNLWINEPYVLEKTNQNFQIELNYGKWITADNVDFENQWWSVVDQRDQKIITLPLQWNWSENNYPINLTISTKKGKLIIQDDQQGWSALAFIGQSISTNLKIEMTKQEWSDYENTI